MKNEMLDKLVEDKEIASYSYKNVNEEDSDLTEELAITFNSGTRLVVNSLYSAKHESSGLSFLRLAKCQDV